MNDLLVAVINYWADGKMTLAEPTRTAKAPETAAPSAVNSGGEPEAMQRSR